jgi:hypothetical protein
MRSKVSRGSFDNRQLVTDTPDRWQVNGAGFDRPDDGPPHEFEYAASFDIHGLETGEVKDLARDELVRVANGLRA